MIRRNMLILFAACFVTATLADRPPMHGYFGDRSGVYPDAKPPVHWGENTNVLWKILLPNLGSGAPVVAQKRVFVLSEPGWKNDLPVVSCYDADSGLLKWEKEIDHLHLTVPDEAERKKVRETWHRHLTWCRDFYLLYHDYVAAKDSPDVKKRMEQMGIKKWGANYLYGKGYDKEKVSEYSMYTFYNKHPEIKKAMLDLDTWRKMGSHDQMWIGEAFCTPCTDGEALYVVTAWGVYVCYDLNGNVRWMHALPPNRPHDNCAVARSPIIYGSMVISDIGRMVRAFDRKTGRLEWEHKREGGVHEFVSPVVFRVGNDDLLWCAGPAAYTLPDGKPLKIEGWKNNGMIVAVNRDKPDTLFFTGGGEHGGWEGKGKCEHPPPAAVRFAREGDVLKAKVLWCTLNGEPRIGTYGLLWHNGRLYLAHGRNGGTIVDAETGIVLRGLFGGAVPQANHHIAIAGGYVYGLVNGGAKNAPPQGVMHVHDLEGRFVARNVLSVTPYAKLDKDSQTKRLSQWYSWPKGENREWCFTYSSAFAVGGDSIYIRSLDHLYCIRDGAALTMSGGDKAKRAEELFAGAAKNRNAWNELAALGPAAKALVPRIEALLPKHREPWKLVRAIAAIDPAAAKKHQKLLVDTIVKSNLNDHLTPNVGGLLYELGDLPREQLAQIEASVDKRMYPHGGPKLAQSLLNAFYRRSGEVGFSKVHVRPYPWQGGPKRGEDITLEWDTLNATKVTIEPGIGEVEIQGKRQIRTDTTVSYTFTAEGAGGPTVRKIVVTVK